MSRDDCNFCDDNRAAERIKALEAQVQRLKERCTTLVDVIKMLSELQAFDPEEPTTKEG